MKKQIRFICLKCGKEPVPDPVKSNANWKVLPAICPDCGERLELRIEDEHGTAKAIPAS